MGTLQSSKKTEETQTGMNCWVAFGKRRQKATVGEESECKLIIWIIVFWRRSLAINGGFKKLFFSTHKFMHIFLKHDFL